MNITTYRKNYFFLYVGYVNVVKCEPGLRIAALLHKVSATKIRDLLPQSLVHTSDIMT